MEMKNREFTEKINILTSEKLTLQEEVKDLKETIRKKESLYNGVFKKEKEMKEKNEVATEKVAKLESDLKETKARLDSERRARSQFAVNNNGLQREVSRKETELRTLQNNHELAVAKMAELEEEVRENQARFDIILRAARPRQSPPPS